MKTIMAPTDFSSISLNAVSYAADMAVSVNASLFLVHICPLPIVINEMPYPADEIDNQVSEAEEKIREIKEDIIKSTGGKIKVYAEVRTGTVMQEIVELGKAINPHIVVMGTQGSNAIEKILFGSNTVWATKHLSWPLIIVPREATFKEIKKVGLACDLKRVLETFPVDEIKKLVKEFGAKLSVIHVNTEGEELYGPEIIDQAGLLQEMLEDVHPSYHFLNDTEIEDGLGDFAEDNQLDLLIVVPKKHNIIGQLFHKSHSKNLVLHSNIPVMAVHE